jgi:membrane associated rhomboid family serine protease
MFPLKDDNPTYRKPYVTIGLIIICVLVFLWQVGSGAEGGHNIVYRYGFIPALLSGLGELPPHLSGFPEYLTSVTSMFLHGGWFHLLGNMMFLWIFGDNIEDVLGHYRFVVFYILSGLGAVLLQYLSDPTSALPMVGASGAIAGVLGAYIVLFPRAKILTLIWFGFFLTTVRIRALWFLGAWFLMQWVSALSSNADVGVAWWAHIGGFIAGFLVLLILKPRSYIFGRKRGPWG